MNFLNLGIGELLGLLGVVSAGVVALYLLDRSKRRQVVATLRFWTPAEVSTDVKHRRKIQQPLSLLLQLISLALLLIAIAGPQFGIFDGAGRDHVVILDTSAWLGALGARGTLMDQAKASANAYLATLPSRDRVMLLRADALTTPATAFESSRSVVESAIAESQPGASALNLGQALQFAQRAQNLHSEQPGEIVLISPNRVNPEDAKLTAIPPNFRMIAVDAPRDNVGLRQMGLRRSTTEADSWDIFVSLHNYGTQPRGVDLGLHYADSPAGAKHISLRPGADEEETFTYKEKIGGWVEARLNVNDALPQDDRAVVQVPSQETMHVIVYSNKPDALRPLFGTDPRVTAEFLPTSAYNPTAKSDVIVLDDFVPPPLVPKVNAIWISPPAGAPVGMKGSVTNAPLVKWNADSAAGAGLYTRDVTLQSSLVFRPRSSDDVVVAESSDGPVIMASEARGRAANGRGLIGKQLFIGFNPAQNSMKYEIATPLLIANTLRWMAPDAWRRREMQAGRVGTVTVPLDKNTNVAEIRVLDEKNEDLPFSLNAGSLQFFVGKPGTIRVQMGDREMVYSLSLPDLAEASWDVPARALKGVPRTNLVDPKATDIWPWLAILGAIGLGVDWFMFGRNKIMRLRSGTSPIASAVGTGWKKAS